MREFLGSMFSTSQSSRRRGCRPGFRSRCDIEQLESRRVLAASAAFNAVTGALTVSDGSATANNIVISYQVIGMSTNVTVTDQGVSILSAVAASGVKSITVASGGGNDTVNLGAVGSAQFTQLFQSPVVDGGDGNDTIYGSKLADLLYGVAGNDTVLGLEAADFLYGGAGRIRSMASTEATTPPTAARIRSMAKPATICCAAIRAAIRCTDSPATISSLATTTVMRSTAAPTTTRSKAARATIPMYSVAV